MITNYGQLQENIKALQAHLAEADTNYIQLQEKILALQARLGELEGASRRSSASASTSSFEKVAKRKAEDDDPGADKKELAKLLEDIMNRLSVLELDSK